MKLPEHTRVDVKALRHIAEELKRPDADIALMPGSHIFNAVYAIGSDYVLRVPRAHPAHVNAIKTESVVAPIAVDALVRTPQLRMYDDTEALIAAPFTVYNRVPGLPLEQPRWDPGEPTDVWTELGADLAHLHRTGSADSRARGVRGAEELPSAQILLTQRLDEGWFTEIEFRWLRAWLDRLLDENPGRERRLIHGDIQASNVLVDQSGRYLALIDWGSAGWGDPAWDFAAVPLQVVPRMLEGYVQSGGMPGLEAAIVARRAVLWLLTLPRGAVPGRSWAERPLAMLLDMLEFSSSNPEWRDLFPGRPAIAEPLP